MSRLRTIAVTRPGEDGRALANRLAAQGFTTFHVPMLEIVPVPGCTELLHSALLAKPQAMCVTSKHAVHALAQMKHAHELPLLAVGDATAKMALNAGFINVSVADGSVASLLALITARCKPENGMILYIRGKDVTLDLTAELKERGFNAHEAIVYEAHPLDSFPADFSAALGNNELDEIMFFSRASASNYVRLVLQSDMAALHKTITALCISHNVMEALSALPWKQCEVSTARLLAV